MAVKSVMSDYLAQHGNILSKNYTIRHLVVDFTDQSLHTYNILGNVLLQICSVTISVYVCVYIMGLQVKYTSFCAPLP